MCVCVCVRGLARVGVCAGGRECVCDCVGACVLVHVCECVCCYVCG